MQFKAGDTEIIDGVPHVRDEAGNWLPQTNSRPSPGSVQLTPPNPAIGYKTTQERYGAAAAPYEVEQTRNKSAASAYDPAKAAADLANTQSKPVYDRFGAVDKLRDNIRNDKRIQAYEGALPVWASALKAPGSPEGDTMLVNAFAKTLDPTTGVQQREGDAIAAAAPSYEQMKARLLKEFGSDGAGNFTEEGRRRIKETITVRMKTLATGYNSSRDEWRKYIKAAGIPDVDAETVLGKHFGADFQQYEADYKGSPVHNLDGSLGATPPTMSPEQVDRELQRLVRAGDRAGAQRLIAQYKLTTQPGDLKNAYGKGNAQVVRQEQPQPQGNPLQQLGNDFLQIPAGLAEGVAALPDMAAKGMGSIMAAPVDWLGFDRAAAQLRSPPQVGAAIEGAVPVPQDWNGWGLRQTARLGGGVIGMPAGFTNQAVEQLVGGVPKGFNPANAPKVDPYQVYKDARSLGIEPTANAVGGPTSRSLASVAHQTWGGVRPTVAGAERMVEQGGRALSGIASREGAAMGREGLGETATAGALKYRNTSRTLVGNMYQRAQKAAGDIRVKPDRTIQELDRQLGDLNNIPMGSEGARYLSELRDELVTKFPDGVTIDGLRGMRTQLRDKFYKEGLRGSDIERRVNDVVQTVSDDITQTLVQAGKKDAARLYKRADAAWAERIKTLDEVVMPIIGKKGEKSGEQVAQALQSATRGNGAKFRNFLRALPEEEAGDVRASVIEALGRSKAGAQDAEGGAFSFAEMLTNWNRMDNTARNALFQSSDRAAMDKLARVASEVKDASRYANHSNSGGVFLNGLTLYTGLNDLASGGMALGGTYVLAKALASPGVASVVARMGSARTPGQVKAASNQLTNFAKKYPGAATEIVALRDSLLRAMNDNAPRATSAAASNGGQENYEGR